MEKKVIYCDICGAEHATSFSFAVDSEMDAAGSSDTIHKRVDLCQKHAAAQLQLFIETLTWPERGKLANVILKDRKLYLDHMTKAERMLGVA